MNYAIKHNRWIPIEESKPLPRELIYIVCEEENPNGEVYRFQTTAEYVPYKTIPEDDYMGDEWQGEGDYDKEKDEYYTPEGFYEWQSETDIHYKVSAKITHWMPALAFP